MIGIITNHNFLAAYEYKIGRIDGPKCTICEKGKEMNSHHIIYECEAQETIRLNSFQKLIEPITLEDGPENPQKFKYDLKAKHLVQFLINIWKVYKIIPGYDDEE